MPPLRTVIISTGICLRPSALNCWECRRQQWNLPEPLIAPQLYLAATTNRYSSASRNRKLRRFTARIFGPRGWAAGEWGEWYPDVLGEDGKLTIESQKPYWQSGWLKQHDRLIGAMTAMKARAPLIISGDLHAVAMSRMFRSGALDLTANPI